MRCAGGALANDVVFESVMRRCTTAKVCDLPLEDMDHRVSSGGLRDCLSNIFELVLIKQVLELLREKHAQVWLADLRG